MATPTEDTATYVITADGNPIPATVQVISIQIDHHLNTIPSCEITLQEASDHSSRNNSMDTFVPGTTLEISLGHNGKNTPVFTGIVLEQNLHYQPAESPVLQVVCKDLAVKMTLGRKNAVFYTKTDAEILQQLIENQGLQAKVSSTDTIWPEMVQYYTTDWEFMLARAEANGLVVRVDAGEVTICPPTTSLGHAGQFTYGDNVYAFDGHLNATYQYAEVAAEAWDYDNQILIKETVAPQNQGTSKQSTKELAKVLGLPTHTLQTGGFLNKEAMTSRAKSVGQRSAFAKIRGTIKGAGSAKAKPGTELNLHGFGETFNGQVYVSGVQHTLSEGNWTMECTLGLSHQPQVSSSEAPLAAGLIPAVQGLQIGKVKDTQIDPEGNFRVLVLLPRDPKNLDGIWARLATFYASKGVGALFYPEKNDEVVLGFFNDDPRYPVILGSLYSSNLTTPTPPSEGNPVKEIVTKGQLKVSLDDQQRTITLSTPNQNQLILNDEDKRLTLQDQNGNKIVLSESGISIESPNQVSIRGQQKVDVQGDQISQSASSTISGSAAQVILDADMTLTLKSAVETNLSGGALCGIKGALVTIN